MSRQIFREVSLARLASPEQLDQILKVTGPKDWLGLSAIGTLLVMAAVWSYTGSIPTTAAGQGVVVRSGGVKNVVARGSGLVLNLSARVGDKVTANQVVARIAQPVLMVKIKSLREQLAEAERQREEAGRVRQDSTKLSLEALERQKSNTEKRIAALEEQAKLTADQIPVEEQLLSRGLVTSQQVISVRQKLVGIRNDIDSMRAQIKQQEAEAFNLRSQPERENSDRKNMSAALARELAGMEKELTMVEQVVTPYSGEVVEIRAANGALVSNGEPILTVQPDVDQLELIGYLPSSQVKDLAAGMEVQVSPAAVKREEYGFLLGKVTYVFNYPATAAAMMRHFENEPLVTSLTLKGPVTEVRIALIPNASTASGFEWSTPKGAPITLSGGTICGMKVVTRRQKPMELLVPYLKEKVGIS
jgi:HlyD family secretion protein